MTKELYTFLGRCKCKRKFKFRLVNIRENANDKNSPILVWLIYRLCNKCKRIYLQGIFKQSVPPIENVDFVIDWNQIAKEKEEK